MVGREYWHGSELPAMGGCLNPDGGPLSKALRDWGWCSSFQAQPRIRIDDEHQVV